MDKFLRQSMREYVRRTKMRQVFIDQSKGLRTVVENAERLSGRSAAHLCPAEEILRLFTAPLIDIAWSDGRVTTREMEAVMEVGEIYGFIENEKLFCSVMSELITRPSRVEIDLKWSRIHQVFDLLTPNEFEDIGFCLLVQAQYVAESGSNSLINFIRADRMHADERDSLTRVGNELRTARIRKKNKDQANGSDSEDRSSDQSKSAISLFSKDGADGIFIDRADTKELLPLIPLLDLAWAKDRITNRERNLIFAAAKRIGVEPGSSAYNTLSDWLDILSNRAAKANGSNEEERFAGEGSIMCAEVVEAVKRTGQKSNERNRSVVV